MWSGIREQSIINSKYADGTDLIAENDECEGQGLTEWWLKAKTMVQKK